MCGIAGVFNIPEFGKENVSNMISKIRYRGIDEAGVESIGPLTMGHARLAVVDPENGMQPMTNQDNSVWVTFNGEIYNYVELREELKAKGYHFKSRCDTEVLVHLWSEEGEKMLERLIGMFSFFVWDTKQQKGMLARDRQGIKPCFIAEYKGGIAFASEMKAILSLPGFPKEINDDGLKDVFSFNYCLPPKTCFKGINHLEPGHYLLFDGTKQITKKCYWKWPLLEEREDVSFEEFSALMDDAVRMQMRFDVDGGMYLSGGVDSSIVGSHLVKQWNRDKLDAVGLKFTDPAYSEYPLSEQAASLLNVDLSAAEIDPTMIPEIAEKVSYHAEQPHGDFSFFLFYILARQANHKGRIVMFNGDGPDEILSGFAHNEKYFHNQQRMNFSFARYLDVITYMKKDMRESLLSKEFESSTAQPIDTFEQVLAPWQDLDPIEQIIAYECTALSPGNNLVKGDRMGAAWSVEGRSPFLDHRITELLTKLPVKQKFHDGYGKYFLKNYAVTKFPHQFIFRKKTMPTMPIGEWLKESLYDWAYDIFNSGNSYCLNKQAVLNLLEDHKKGKGNYTRELRTLLMTKLWLNSL